MSKLLVLIGVYLCIFYTDYYISFKLLFTIFIGRKEWKVFYFTVFLEFESWN